MEKTVVIKNATGLHARPAGMFVKKASEFTSTVEVLAKGKTVNAKSILSMFKFSLILSVIILPSVNIQINKNVTQPILTMTSAISICLQTHINCSYYLLTAQSPIKIFIKKDHCFHKSLCENSGLFLNGQCSPFVSYTYRENRSPFMI